MNQSQRSLKPRHRRILNALEELGGMASTRAIADRTGLHVNGVAQSLGVLDDRVEYVSGIGGDTQWALKSAPIERTSRD